jgi:hypothetical protein
LSKIRQMPRLVNTRRRYAKGSPRRNHID